SFSDAQVWDFSTGRPAGSGKPISGTGVISLSPHGRRILAHVKDANGYIERIYDAAGNKPPTQFEREGIPQSAFSPQGTNVVTEFGDSAQVWDTATGKLVGKELKQNGWVNDAEFSQDGKRVVTASDDGAAAVWDASTGTMIG